MTINLILSINRKLKIIGLLMLGQNNNNKNI